MFSFPTIRNTVVDNRTGDGRVPLATVVGVIVDRASEMIVTRTLTSVPSSGSTCISHLFQCCSLPLGLLTSNVRRRISTSSPASMCSPAGMSHPKAVSPIVNIGMNSAVYPLGASANSQRSTPSLRFEDCEMVVEEGQAWVVVGTSGAGKDVLLQVSRSSHCIY